MGLSLGIESCPTTSYTCFGIFWNKKLGRGISMSLSLPPMLHPDFVKFKIFIFILNLIIILFYG